MNLANRIKFWLFNLTVFFIVFSIGNTSYKFDEINNILSSHPGHLKPFGFQGKNIPVESLDHFPSPSVFFNNYVNLSKPFLMRGGARFSPAYERWTDEYFLSLPEARQYNVAAEQAKKENRSLSPEDLPFSEFVKRYKKEDIYMVNPVPDFIGKDVYFPPCLLCPCILDYLLDKLMWFSSGGTKSVFHYDTAENINCLFAGEKTFYMVDYKDADKVVIENKKSAYSDVDVERVDLVKYPSLKDVEYHHVKMEAGDCLYIPYHWFHHVISHGRNIAVNIWWSASAKPYLPDCNILNTTIDKIKFHGFNMLFPRETMDGIKDALKTMFKEYDGSVTIEQFRSFMITQSFLFELEAEWSTEMVKMLDQTFRFMDEPTGDSLLTEDDVRLTTNQIWEKIIPIVKELYSLVEEQFEQDGEEFDDFGPPDSKVEENEYLEHDKTEL